MAISVKNMVYLHSPYSPDLVLCKFWLFPKVEMIMKSKHFESVEDIKTPKTARMKDMKSASELFSKLQELWDKYVQSQRNYFEGD